MGMFDYVNFKMPCPECGEEVTGFQSKDTGCSMDEVEPEATNRFYAPCDNCGAWIDIVRDQTENKPKRTEPLTLEQVKALGFVVELTPSNLRPWAKDKAKKNQPSAAGEQSK